MAKRLKLRLSRVFQTCHSQDPSDPVPSCFLRLPPVNPSLTAVHSPPKHHPSPPPIKRHVICSALVSYGCGCRSTEHLSDDDRTGTQSRNLRRNNNLFHWKHEPDFQVIAKLKRKKTKKFHETTPRRKVYSPSSVVDGEGSGEVVDFPVKVASNVGDKKKKKRQSRKKKMMATTAAEMLRVRISTSSIDTGGFFSSEDHEARETENEDEGEREDEKEEEETETLVSSSRSLSTTDSSSEFNPHHQRSKNTKSPKNKKKSKKKKKKMKKKKKKKGTPNHDEGSEVSEAARLSVFRRLIPCTIDGKVRESFAVVKRSEDPYEDFKRSMVEMISEKEMFEEEDLVQLLHCFLSLNSKRFHGVILEAFLEIWEGLFGVNNCGNSYYCSTSSSRRSL